MQEVLFNVKRTAEISINLIRILKVQVLRNIGQDLSKKLQSGVKPYKFESTVSIRNNREARAAGSRTLMRQSILFVRSME